MGVVGTGGTPAGAPTVPAAPEPGGPPSSNTGVLLTWHWLRGGFEQSEEDVLDLTNTLTGGGYVESHDWGRFMYRRHHVFVGGLRVYVDPRRDNMPAVMVDCPGEACDLLGLERLRVLFCNARLSRADIALDGAPFAPADVAGWVRDGKIRCRSGKRHYIEDIGVDPDGDTVTLGSRASGRYMRVYDGRGFTRVELELKRGYARAALGVLLADIEEIPTLAAGVVRDFVDFVDIEQDSNVSRAPLLPSWEAFVAGIERVRLALAGRPSATPEAVVHYIEHQVAAMLYTYFRLGNPIGGLLRRGKSRVRARHRAVLAMAGVTAVCT